MISHKRKTTHTKQNQSSQFRESKIHKHRTNLTFVVMRTMQLCTILLFRTRKWTLLNDCVIKDRLLA